MNETLRKSSLNVNLQLINLHIQPNSNWPPQLISLDQHNNDYYSVIVLQILT